MASPRGFFSGLFAALDNPRGFAYHPSRVAGRVHNRRWSLALASAGIGTLGAFASMTCGCSGTLPGLGPEPPPVAVRQNAPGVVTRTVLQEGVGRRTVAPRPPEAGTGAGAVSGSYSNDASYSPAPPPGTTQTPASPPAMTSNDVRDRQLDLLTEAVAALRQEVAKSYEHSQQLTQENEQLRGVVASLRRELAKTKGANKVLKDHLEALEKRMRELRPPPLEPSTSPEAAAPPSGAPSEAPPANEAAPEAAAPSADGGLDTGPPAQGAQGN